MHSMLLGLPSLEDYSHGFQHSAIPKKQYRESVCMAESRWEMESWGWSYFIKANAFSILMSNVMLSSPGTPPSALGYIGF